jgi:hypothetical protein
MAIIRLLFEKDYFFINPADSTTDEFFEALRNGDEVRGGKKIRNSEVKFLSSSETVSGKNFGKACALYW